MDFSWNNKRCSGGRIYVIWHSSLLAEKKSAQFSRHAWNPLWISIPPSSSHSSPPFPSAIFHFCVKTVKTVESRPAHDQFFSGARTVQRQDAEQERVRPSFLLLIHSPFLSCLARLSARLNSKYLIQLRVVKRTRGHIIPYVYVSIRRGSGEQSTNLSLRAPWSSLPPRAFYTRTLTPRLIGFYAPFPIR